MKQSIGSTFVLPAMLMLLSFNANAQEKKKSKEVYTGTIYSMNGSAFSTGFTLTIKDETSDDEAKNYLSILAEGDQDKVLNAIKDLELGRLSATGQVGRNLIIVRKSQRPDGQTRIVVAFERWQKMAEIRGGYRSQDYPFGIMEIIVNAKGKGSGTFIAACKIDLKRDKKTGKYQLELENFGTYPHKVMGVMRRD